MVWLFFVLLVLSWCLWFCCAVSQPPQCKYNPLRCPFRLKDGSHYSVSMSAVLHTVTLTHTQLLAVHTNQICSHTFEQNVHRPKNAHTHIQCCNSCWLLSLACLPHPLSFSHSFTPFKPCMGMRCLTPTNVTFAICAAQKNTAVHDCFPFLHPQACVVGFFHHFHPFMPMKIRPVEWMEIVFFHSSKRRNAIRCENNSGRWGNTWRHSLPTFR